MGVLLLLLSFIMAAWGFYQQDAAYASSTKRLETTLAANADTTLRSSSVSLMPAEIRRPLTANEEAGLEYAIMAEYGTLSLYRNFDEKIESSRLFDQMIKDEQKYISLLIQQAENYHLTIPANVEETYTSTVTKIDEACLAGVNAERVKNALFEDLLTATTDIDLKRVYSEIRNTSLTDHLTAFYQCR